VFYIPPLEPISAAMSWLLALVIADRIERTPA